MMEKNVLLPFPLEVDVPLPEATLSERLWMTRKKMSGHLKLKRSLARIYELYEATKHEDSKPFRQVVRELHCWVSSGKAFPVRMLINYYFQFRLQYKGADSSGYVFESEWLKYAQPLLRYAGNECAVLNNKDSAWHAFVRQGLSVPRRFGFLGVENGIPLVRTAGQSEVIPLSQFLRDRCPRIFVKPAGGMKGESAFLVEWVDDERCRVSGNIMRVDEFSSLITPPLLVEEAVRQHPAIAALHPESLNTLRLVTMRGADGRSRYIAGMQRMGIKEMHLDNLSQGGLAVGIDPAGILRKWGYTEDPRKKGVSSHPDTGIVFKGRRIPFWRETVDLACRAHEGFPCIHNVGWDIAVTAEGPVLIEANCSYGMLEIQLIDHGLRGAFETILRPAALAVMQRGRSDNRLMFINRIFRRTFL